MRVPAADSRDSLVDQAAEVTRRHQVVMEQVEKCDQKLVDIAVRPGPPPGLGEQDVGGERLIAQLMPGGQAQDGVGREPGEQGIIGFVSLAPQFDYPPLGLVRAPSDTLAGEPGSKDAIRLAREFRSRLGQERHERRTVLDHVVRKHRPPQPRWRHFCRAHCSGIIGLLARPR